MKQRLWGQLVLVAWVSVSVVMVIGVAFYFGRDKPKKRPAEATPSELARQHLPRSERRDEAAAFDSHELHVEDVQLGKGAMAELGKTLTVHYTARLEDGTLIDDSHKNPKAFVFILGDGKVIAGWDKGLLGMRVGGRRNIMIPPELAYGKRGISGVVPPDASLSFEIDLLAVE